MEKQLIIILGGTFDPVHRGHVYIAVQSYQHLSAQACWLMPCGQPVHRNLAQVTAVHHRVAMLQLAIDAYTFMRVETYEVDHLGPSITLDTLRVLKQRYPKASFCYLMGQEVMADVVYWDHWQALIDYAHMIVVNRELEGKKSLKLSVPALWQSRIVTTIDALRATDRGAVYLLSLPPLQVAATEIRARMGQQLTVDAATLHPDVLAYIQKEGLYATPNL